MTVIGLSGTQYQLEAKPFKSGGEGAIHRVLGGSSKKVAKIYSDVPTCELEEKLTIMVNRPPSTKVLSQVAWPLDVIYDSNKRFVGFVMPELNINAELAEIYKYPSQTNLSSQDKVIIAENICAVISEVHKAGYVFGDFNPRNIGVDKNNGTVAFLDTDTYHVVDSSSKKAYRCNVCAPGYSAPELLEKCSAYTAAHPSDSSQAYAKTPLPTFTTETDNFSLAVHIFKLLMNGYTPYGGIKDTDSPSQASPGTGDAAVRRDNYCFKPGFKHQSVAIPTFDSFPQEISDFFTRAFIIGRYDPKQRPSAVEWHGVLEAYEKTLATCPDNPLHQYDRGNQSCPLCDADRRYGISVAPPISQKNIRSVVRTPINTHTSGTGSSSSGSSPHSSKQNWWQRLSMGARTAVVIASVCIVILGFGVFNGWFGNSNPTDLELSLDEEMQSPDTSTSSAQPSSNQQFENPQSSTENQLLNEQSLAKGDVIPFGQYNWIVLEVMDDRALILTEEIIENRRYHSENTNTSWAQCELQLYLNNEFIEYFDQHDKARIIETEIITDNNPWFGTPGGDAIMNRVFLLSIQEVVYYFGDSGQMINRPQMKEYEIEMYADLPEGPLNDLKTLGYPDYSFNIEDQYNFERIAESPDSTWRNSDGKLVGWWWLRTPGIGTFTTSNVDAGGSIHLGGLIPGISSEHGIRPALWLSLR